MKCYEEWKQEKEKQQVLSELTFDPRMMSAMRQGGAVAPQSMRAGLTHNFKDKEAELDNILAQSIAPLKRFVAEHPELQNLVSMKLHKLWMNVRSGTQMQGRAGILSRRMDQLNKNVNSAV